MNLKGIFLLASVILASFGCKTTEQSALQQDVTQREEFRRLMEVLGADSSQDDRFCAGACHGSASAWHSVTKTELLNWAKSTREMTQCFAFNLDAKKQISCFQEGGEFTSNSIKKLGMWRVVAKYEPLKKLFADAYGDDADDKYQDFLKGGGSVVKPQMPTPDDNLQGKALSEEDSVKLVTIFSSASTPRAIEAYFGGTTEEAHTCTPMVSDEYKKHLENMEYSSWRARLLAESPRSFYGCNYTSSDFSSGTLKDILRKPINKCFQRGQNVENPGLRRTFENWEKTWSEGWDRAVDETGTFLTQKIVVLSDLQGCTTTFWMRSSPDGRYVGNGNSECDSPDFGQDASRSQGFFIDLKHNKMIGVNAPYDPGFFPDNNGFTFISQGAAYFCNMEGLNPGAANPSQVPGFFEIKKGKYCSESTMGVYQHVGAAVDPNDPQYTVVRGSYENDDGGTWNYVRDPTVESFTKETYADLYKLCENSKCGSAGLSTENTFGVSNKYRIPIPNEGDFGISPSSMILTSRISPGDGAATQLGYGLRTYKLNSTDDYNLNESKLVGRVCIRGGKASMSFDERFLVTHHYTDGKTYQVQKGNQTRTHSDWSEFNRALGDNEFTGPEDPEFEKYIEKSSNIWLADLKTGKSYRLTFMNPGQFALYPHFRADGWMYFLVRDKTNRKDFVVASDAALQIALKN